MDTSRPWPSIIQCYEDDLKDTALAIPMLRLVKRLDEAGYVKAGLQGAISMHDLCLSQSRHIFCGDPRLQNANPRLRISPRPAYFHGPIVARLRYEDGSEKAWETFVEWDELTERVERLLVKRLRWFK